MFVPLEWRILSEQVFRLPCGFLDDLMTRVELQNGVRVFCGPRVYFSREKGRCCHITCATGLTEAACQDIFSISLLVLTLRFPSSSFITSQAILRTKQTTKQDHIALQPSGQAHSSGSA